MAESVVGKLSFSTLAVTFSRPGALFDGKEIQIMGTGHPEGYHLLDNSLILDCVLQQQFLPLTPQIGRQRCKTD